MNNKKPKKILSKLFILVLFLGPILAACGGINPTGSNFNESTVNVGDRTKFASDPNFSLQNFTKNVLTKTDVNTVFLKQFVKELIYNWFLKQSKIDSKKMIGDTSDIPKLVSDNQKKITDDLNNLITVNGGITSPLAQTNLFDENGGNAKTNEHAQLLDLFYEQFRTRYVTLQSTNFTINKNIELDNNKNFIYNDNALVDFRKILTKNDVNDAKNWNKIGFFPSLSEAEKKAENKNIAFGIADLANYNYRRWQENVKPINVIMSLWKYDDKANRNLLSSVYNTKTLANSFPTKADYKFPYFGEEKADLNLATNNAPIKFKQFTTNLDSLTPSDSSNGAFDIPVSYTDDSATSIPANLNDIFNSLYPQFAAASIHKFLQATVVNSDNAVNNANDIIKDVNKITKDNLKTKDLINLFLEKNKNNGNIGIAIDSKIFNSSSTYKDNCFVMDQRDVENNPWIFLRNKAGVHAIAIDGYNFIKNGINGNNDKTKTTSALIRSYQFYNFRTLQKLLEVPLEFSKTTSNIKPLDEANKFIVDNFDALIYDYYQANKNNVNSIFYEVTDPSGSMLGSRKSDNSVDMILNSQTLDDFKKLLDSVSQFYWSKAIAKSISNMSEKMQSEYLEFNLKPEAIAKSNVISASTDSDKTDEKNLVSNYVNGLASVLPYDLDTSFSTSSSATINIGKYKKLSAIYDQKVFNSYAETFDFSFGKQNLVTIENTYRTQIDKLIKELKLAPSDNINNVAATKIILTNVDVFNSVMTPYLNNDSNISSIVANESIINNYLKDIVDPKTFKIKDDNKLGSNFNSLKDNSTKLPINQAIENVYYAKEYLTSKNPLIYGGFEFYETKDGKQSASDISKISKNFNDKQKQIFDRNFRYESDKSFRPYSTDNNDYLSFLQALEYITKNRFENLRLYLRSSFSAQTKAAFAWLNNLPKQQVTSQLTDTTKLQTAFSTPKLNYQNKLINPFVDSNLNFSDYNKNYSSSFNFTKTANSFTNKTTSFDKTFSGFSGLIIQEPTRTWTNANQSQSVIDALNKIQNFSNSDRNGILFNYGSREGLINFVNNFDSTAQIESTAQLLQELISNLQIAPITTSTVTISNTSQVHALTFQEKKNALVALINNYKLPSLTTNISIDEFKKFYGTDPNNNFISLNNKYVTQTSGKDFNENIKTSLFTRFADFFESSNNTAQNGNKFAFSIDNDFNQIVRAIQVNSTDFENSNNFINLISKYLGDDGFANWLIQLASEKIFQDLAKSDFDESIIKMTVFDARFQKALSSTYIINK